MEAFSAIEPQISWPASISAVPQSQPLSSRDRKAWQILVTSNNETSADVECESESQLLFLKPLFSRRRFSSRALRSKKNFNCKNYKNKPNASTATELSTTSTRPATSNTSTVNYNISSVHNNREKERSIFPPVSSITDDSLVKGNQNQRSKRKTNSILKNGQIFTVKDNLNGSSPILVIELDGQNDTAMARSEPPVARTKVILKPLARSKAGRKGTAISSPISTVFVKRGDYVEIEYLPEAIADVGDDGTAISRPELFIHFVDRRRK